MTAPHSASELARPATVPSCVTQRPPHEKNASRKQSPAQQRHKDARTEEGPWSSGGWSHMQCKHAARQALTDAEQSDMPCKPVASPTCIQPAKVRATTKAVEGLLSNCKGPTCQALVSVCQEEGCQHGHERIAGL